MSDQSSGVPGNQQPVPPPPPASAPDGGGPQYSAAPSGAGEAPSGAPDNTAPQDAAPQYAAPQYAAPQQAASPYAAPQQAAPQDGGAQYGAPQPGSAPYGSAQYGSAQYSSAQYGAGQYAGQPPTPGSGLAITALVIGILALLISWIPFVNIAAIIGGLLGVVLGAVALAKVKRGTGGGKGLAIGGLVTSVLAVIASIVVLVLTLFVLRDVSNTVSGAIEDLERETSGEPIEIDPAAVLSVGETAELTDYTVTVTAINPAADDVLAALDEFNPTATYQYALVDLSVTYTGTDDPADTGTPWIELDVELAGADGLTYSDSECMADTERSPYDVSDLAVGGSADYQVCFDAPAEALSGGTVVVSPLLAFLDDSRGFWAVP